ncbi:MAG: alkaline phosphatase family protein [Bacteroidota bacterium]|nr:alkaline phosphatase family protein [Bacteroidota bacterium]
MRSIHFPIRTVLCAFLLHTFSSLTAQIAEQDEQPHWADPPKLVVGIIVDQMRTDLIYRYWNNFGENGFKRLIRDGAFLRDAHFDYSPTYTGPGHASIYTGTTPAFHGIVGNDMFLRSTGGGLYCAADARMSGIGCEGATGQRSPVNLMSTTIADELERRTAGRSKTIGVSMKDRSAIMPIGRTGDAAYWFAGGTGGHFVTSSWYRDTLPKWLTEFNAEDRADLYLKNVWDLKLPSANYQQVLADDNEFEKPIPGAASPTLPIDLKPLTANGTGVLLWTPWGNTITTDVALAALKGEAMGSDGITDLLAISYSSTDMLAHYTGIRSLELEDMYIRLDQEIERLLKELDGSVGAGECLLFLTADHGAGDEPEYLRSLKGSASNFDQRTLEPRIDSTLNANFGKDKWVIAITNEQVFLNDQAISAKGLEPARVQRLVADILLKHPLVAYALTASDLVSQVYCEGPQRSIQRGFMPQRSGDVCMALRPGVLDEADVYEVGKGSAHGSVWNYDTHVPIIFLGHGIQSGEVLRRISITDIAPTVSLIVGMTMPDASIGKVITEVIAP